MQHGLKGFAVVLSAGAFLAVAAPAAAAHPEPGGHASGLAHPPRRLAAPLSALRLVAPLTATAAGADYPGALWEPASPSNYSFADRPFAPAIKRIVIHVAEGGFASTYTWFRNPRAQASAHFVVGLEGQVAQMVHLRDIAWHAGNWPYNETSVGIEHAGFTGHTRFPYAEYRASARLAGWLARRFLITPDRRHVIGHNEVPDPFHPGKFGGADHHTDPGRTWKWTPYMALLRAFAHTTYQQVVDNADAERVRYDHDVWHTSSTAPSHQGANYLVARPSAGRPVAYRLKLPATDRYDVWMRWPCSSAFNRRVTVGLATLGGFKTVVVDESQNCTRGWNRLGNFALPAGDSYRLVVLRSSSRGGTIAADAVKVVEQSDLQPPTAPALSASTTPAMTLRASWTRATDNVGVGAYQLWVDGALAYLGTGRAATVAGLHCGRPYQVSLRALDLVSNRSPKRPTTVTAPACPTAPTGLALAGHSKTSLTLRWNAGGPTVAGYNVYLDAKLVGHVTATTYTFSGLKCGGTHQYALGVAAYDASGDTSPRTHINGYTDAC
jgi:N-acetyl-anhydromuramyl-L-alanine amidase AmpD